MNINTKSIDSKDRIKMHLFLSRNIHTPKILGDSVFPKNSSNSIISAKVTKSNLSLSNNFKTGEYLSFGSKLSTRKLLTSSHIFDTSKIRFKILDYHVRQKLNESYSDQ